LFVSGAVGEGDFERGRAFLSVQWDNEGEDAVAGPDGGEGCDCQLLAVAPELEGDGELLADGEFDLHEARSEAGSTDFRGDDGGVGRFIGGRAGAGRRR
jgi:hypothetical protein